MSRQEKDVFTRRAFLEGMAAAIGIAVIPMELVRSGVASALPLPASTATSGWPTATYSSFDGCRTNFVVGTIAAISGSNIVITAPQSTSGRVSVALVDSSEVCSRSNVVSGDASTCAVGDRIQVGTTMDPADGSRTVRWLVANPCRVVLRIENLGSTSFSGPRLLRDWATEAGDTVTVNVSSYSNLGQHTPAIGDLYDVMASAETPDQPPTNVWALGGGVFFTPASAAVA
jgi:hypothetical protein